MITAGWVMKPTTRISPPQRGHTRGSTSYTRRIISQDAGHELHSLIHVRHRDPLPASCPASPGNQRVDVRVVLRPVAESPDNRHYPGPKALLLHGRPRHQLFDGLVGRQRDSTQKLPVVQEVDAQHLGDGEHPLGMAATTSST